jgi:hypothetical protein
MNTLIFWLAPFPPFNCINFEYLNELCSGEKMPDVKWPQVVQLNGNVKLHDFEKYIQVLTRSCNRGLMVITFFYSIYLLQYLLNINYISCIPKIYLLWKIYNHIYIEIIEKVKSIIIQLKQ